MSFLKPFLSTPAEQRAINNDPLWQAWAAGDTDSPSRLSEAGIRVTAEGSLELSTLYSCIMLRAEAMMSMPVDAYVTDGGQRRPVPGAVWMTRPNPETDWPAYIGGVMWSLDLHGNLYEIVVRDRSNRARELWLLDAARVQVRRSQLGAPLEYYVDGQLFRGELRHRWLHKLPNRLTGSNPIEHARESIGLGLATQRFGSRFFGDSAIPSGVLEIPGSATPEQLAETKRGWLRAHSGGSRLPAVLQGGMKYSPTTVSPNESQFLETRRFTAAEISAIYRVPPEFVAIGVEGSSLLYQNVSSSWLALIRRALMGPMRVLETAYSELLPPGQRFRFVPDVYLKPDTGARYDAHKVAIEAGFMTPNEARALEDMAPHPDGDVLYAPKSDTAASVAAAGDDDEDPGGEVPGPVPPPEGRHLAGRHDQKTHGGGGAAGALSEALVNDGGFTFNPRTAKLVTSGIAVAVPGHSEIMTAERFLSDPAAGEKMVGDFFRKMRDDGASDSTMMGGWYDREHGEIVLDRVEVFPSSQRAAAIRAGIERGEQAIFDLDRGEEIPTGGTGGRESIDIQRSAAAAGGRAGEAVGRHERRGDRRAGPDDVRRDGGEGASELLALLERIAERRHLSGQHDQKSHGRGGGATAITGMADLSEGLQNKVRSKIASTFGMSEEAAREMVVANMVAAAERGNLADRDWYREANAVAAEIGAQHGFDVDQVAGVIAATSAQKDWDENVAVARGIAKVLGDDEPFEVTQAQIDDFNGYAAGRGSALFAPNDLRPGTYRPSDLPADFITSQHPTIPHIKNGEGVVRAIQIARGANIDDVLRGPKQRSFVNNITRPDDPSTLTVDTWHYVAGSGDHRFTSTRNGETKTLTMAEWRSPAFHAQEYGLDKRAAEKAAKSPQDFFQTSPSSVAEGSEWGPKGYQNNGTYPWWVDATKTATARYNEQHPGTNLNPSEFQAIVWLEVRP